MEKFANAMLEITLADVSYWKNSNKDKISERWSIFQFWLYFASTFSVGAKP